MHSFLPVMTALRLVVCVCVCVCVCVHAVHVPMTELFLSAYRKRKEKSASATMSSRFNNQRSALVLTLQPLRRTNEFDSVNKFTCHRSHCATNCLHWLNEERVFTFREKRVAVKSPLLHYLPKADSGVYSSYPPVVSYHSSGAVWESRWTSWAVRPNEPSGFQVDVKIYCTVLRHWSQLVPNMSHDIWGH